MNMKHLYPIFELLSNDVWYHGSKVKFDMFKAFTNMGTGTTVSEQPIFLTSDKGFAREYAGYHTPFIYTVKVTGHFFNPKDLPLGYDLALSWNGSPEKEGYNYELGNKLYDDLPDIFGVEYIDEIYGQILAGNWDTIESHEFKNWLKSTGYDGSYLWETKSRNLFVFDPAKIEILSVESGLSKETEQERTMTTNDFFRLKDEHPGKTIGEIKAIFDAENY